MGNINPLAGDRGGTVSVSGVDRIVGRHYCTCTCLSLFGGERKSDNIVSPGWSDFKLSILLPLPPGVPGSHHQLRLLQSWGRVLRGNRVSESRSVVLNLCVETPLTNLYL